MAVVFAKVGCRVVINGDFNAAINAGVRRAYAEGFLRKSVVTDPFLTGATPWTTPRRVIHAELVPGDGIELWSRPGFGSENMSAIRMLSPGTGRRA